MKLFGLLPKCLGKIFNGVSHFACNSRDAGAPARIHFTFSQPPSPANLPAFGGKYQKSV